MCVRQFQSEVKANAKYPGEAEKDYCAFIDPLWPVNAGNVNSIHS